MIKNIIFDLGGVIIDYSPCKTFAKYFPDSRDVDLVMDVLYTPDARGQCLWSDADRGVKTVAETVAEACLHLPPRLHETLTRLVLNWWDEMPPLPAMCAFIRELRERGFRLFLLSNTPPEFHARKASIPALAYFDGCVASCDHKLLKPEPALFQVLFDAFALDPAECFFIDDVRKNVDGAAAVGMRGHCYEHGDIKKLRQAMNEIIENRK